MTWSDSFAGSSEQRANAPRPVLKLNATAAKSAAIPTLPVLVSSSSVVLPNWKTDAQAAGRLPWRNLNRSVRAEVDTVSTAALPEVRFETVRSGGQLGNRALVEHHLSRRGAAGVDFVIGNGSRSGDGEIEPASAWRTRVSAPGDSSSLAGDSLRNVRICFVCEAGAEPTPAQRQAAGELLNYLEARFGRLVSAADTPKLL